MLPRFLRIIMIMAGFLIVMSMFFLLVCLNVILVKYLFSL